MIIGLSGYAGSGKDEVAKILVSDYGYRRVAFADKVRAVLYDLDPIVMIDAYNRPITVQDLVNDEGWDDAKKNKEVRALLQKVGLSIRNHIGENTWVQQAMKTMLDDPKLNLKYVITDVRFLNEADMIRANGGQIWRIKRPNVQAVNNHISETELDGYKVDQIFSNNGSLDDLKALVNARMKKLT